MAEPETKQDEKNFGLRIKCTRCRVEQTLDFGRWPVRIVGAIEAICPVCGNRVTYIGTFGQPLQEARFLSDVAAAQAAGSFPAEAGKCEKREGEEGDEIESEPDA